ncbi:leucine-rich repeat protein [Akkermansiaceae bacterium]|nr:leucine-rich repeat protein [bacterium]MDA8969658.1 leucine-rich repeat protein [Akkermansiaceae bacterium]MDB4641176.1 leucine-rich repeat protein [Akkermansiaceae bacterium]
MKRLIPSLIAAALMGSAPAQLVINELLYDPSPGNDVNQDGEANSSQDEFVEIVNIGALPLNIGLYEITDFSGNFFRFPFGTIIGSGEAVLVFAGGNPAPTLNGASVFIGAPSLNNSGDTITLLDRSSRQIDQVRYEDNSSDDKSLNRSPELTGDFVPHTTISGSVGTESPGTRVSGIGFDAPFLDYLSYTTTDGKVTITDCDEDVAGELVIPETIEGNPVTSIGENTFAHCTSLTSITLPNSVTSIDIGAFFDCLNLTNFTIPEGVTSIASATFARCSRLTNITIPESVTSIGINAFVFCYSLASITIPDDVTSIGAGAFNGCRSLPSITIPDGVTSIENQTFSGCRSLTSITIPSRVISIGDSAFSGCSTLRNIAFLPDAAPSLGADVFLSISDSATYTAASGATGYTDPFGDVSNVDTDGDGVVDVSDAFPNDANETLDTDGDGVGDNGDTFPNDANESVDTDGDGVGDNGDNFPNFNDNLISYASDGASVTITKCDRAARGDLIIPDTIEGNPVTSIGDRAFFYCENLTSITIPDSVVTGIGNQTFHQCRSLTSINIPDGVTYIGALAFGGCKELKSITIPDSVTSIGENAFSSCSDLKSITIPDGVINIGEAAFSYCTSLTSITIPDGITSIGNSAFSNCASLTSFTIPDGVTSIGTSAFDRCTSLTSFTIPDGVTNIKNQAFHQCVSLENITIGNGVTSIGNGAFDRCTSLTSITLADSITRIGKDAFKRTNISYDYIDNNLNYLISRSGQIAYLIDGSNASGSVNIPTSVGGASLALIADYAFYQCANLTRITIPDSVTSIGNFAFENCASLTSITIPSGVNIMGEFAFANCLDLTNVTIPDGVTSIGNSAFSNCANLTSVIIGNDITIIPYNAFTGCRSIASITIPSGVTSIGENAFSYCSDLTKLTIPDSVTSIGYEAFYECRSLKSITFQGAAPTVGDRAFSDLANRAEAFVTVEDLSSFGGLGANWNLMTVKVSDLSELIISQPLTQDVPALEEVTFSITAVETPDSYQWSKDGRVIIGANSSKLTLSEVTSDDEGVYTCIMETVIGPIESNEARLTVSRLPQSINFAPIGEIGDGATEVMLSATSSSGLPVTFSSSQLQIVTIDGNNAVFKGVGSADITASQPGNNVYLSADSKAQVINVIDTLRIISAPSSREVDAKSDVVLTVEAEGRGALNYQWYKDGSPFNEINSPLLRLLSVKNNESGSYWCVVSDATSSKQTETFSLVVKSLPQEINFPPLGEVSFAQLQKELNATSTSGLPLRYNSSNPSLVSITQNGQLKINEVGRVTITAYQNGDLTYERAAPVSRELVVVNDLLISSQPSFQEVSALNEAVFSVEATSRAQVSYQWRKDGSDITGSESRILRLSSVTSDDEGSYSCLVRNSFGSVQSSEVTLTVKKLPQTITFNLVDEVSEDLSEIPLNASVDSELPLTFSSSDESVSTIAAGRLVVVGAGTTVITASQEGSNVYLPAESIQQTLIVRDTRPPELELKAFYESLPDKTVSIDATPIEGITEKYDYQWFFNGFPIPEFLGGTDAVQVINGIEASEGKWKVVVTNRLGKAEHSFDYRILVDTDEDGLSDGYEELVVGTNPELPDTDGDGLNDFDEIETYNTDPLRSDSDGDSFLDGFEVANKSAPLVASSQPNLTLEMALSDINGLPALKFETSPIVGGLITIEQSFDLKTWAPVVFFNGEGVAYETTVIRPPAAKNVYRLKVLDQTQ